MIEKPYIVKQKVREILSRYQATPLANRMTLTELFLNRQIQQETQSKPIIIQTIRMYGFQEQS